MVSQMSINADDMAQMFMIISFVLCQEYNKRVLNSMPSESNHTDDNSSGTASINNNITFDIYNAHSIVMEEMATMTEDELDGPEPYYNDDEISQDIFGEEIISHSPILSGLLQAHFSTYH